MQCFPALDNVHGGELDVEIVHKQRKYHFLHQRKARTNVYKAFKITKKNNNGKFPTLPKNTVN